MELRKKIRANDLAMTHLTFNALMISGACSLEEPHPKLLPATGSSILLFRFSKIRKDYSESNQQSQINQILLRM